MKKSVRTILKTTTFTATLATVLYSLPAWAIECSVAGTMLITCHNSHPYTRQNLSTVLREIALCSTPQGITASVHGFDFRTGRETDLTLNVELSKNAAQFPEVPKVFENIANMDTLSLAFTNDHNKALSVFSLGEKIQTSPMKCK